MNNRKKVFIDCGANRGQSVARFRTIFADHGDFEIYCFEPQAEVAAKIDLSPNVGGVIASAVWTDGGEIDFYPGPSTLGSSVYADKTTGNIARSPVRVRAIDLSWFILEAFSPDDFIVLKMNVEGAEYPVLRKMLADGSLARIDRLYVRWHHMKVPSISEAEHAALVRDIERTGLKCEDWWE